MNFDTYRRKALQLHHLYLELLSESGGDYPSHLPGTLRPTYEKYELLFDLTTSEEVILGEIEELKKDVLKKRAEKIKDFEAFYSGETFVTDEPRKANGDKKSPYSDIEKAELALVVYRRKDEKRLEVAQAVFGHTDDSKSAKRQVRQYLAHAETLLVAAGNGTFFEKLSAPLPKK